MLLKSFDILGRYIDLSFTCLVQGLLENTLECIVQNIAMQYFWPCILDCKNEDVQTAID